MATFEDILKSAKLPEGSVPLCLRGDLQRRHEDLERELQDAQEADRQGSSLADGGKARKVAEEIQQIEREMREHTHPFAFRALPSREYRDLVAEHPPRKDDQMDALYGVNMHTFPHTLISKCCIDPPMTVEQVADLCDVLTDGQQMDLFLCPAQLNRERVDIPKSAAASAVLASTAPKSKRPAPGVSAGGGSSAGSLAG
ncbi:hypothetical protein [Actinomadura rugatobispora]|uniref:Uncharacterized protein n=1 Tax=Actinomadura rugatobispora TaxID=1994 RepID=A0ABW0ZQB5_9ACTN|nr:hypothetical protein GCM10010200_036490 [Actinomadura rugatobispora]